jgi:hypothetical protein
MGFGSYTTPLKLLKSRPVRKMNSRFVDFLSMSCLLVKRVVVKIM